jgi:EmrB/QacA subfamily drug resistance transporter
VKNRTVILVLSAAQFIMVLDTTVMNVSISQVVDDLDTTVPNLQFAITAYTLVMAAFMLTGAKFGDIWGRRRAFAIGLGVFTLASAACGLAPDPAVLVAARLVQGVGGALLMPNVLAIIGATYAGAERGRALGVYGLVMGLAAASGQLIGGALVQSVGWRACFLINVPVGLAALALAPRVVRETRGVAGTLDVLGTTLVTVGLTAIVLPLVEGRQHGWPVWTWISLAVAPAILGAFAAHQRRLERRGGAPLIAPALLRARSFSAGLVTQLAFWCGQASFFLVLALYLQQGRGLSALQAGLVFTILAVAYVVASAQAPALAARHGRRLLAAGALVLASGHALLAVVVAAIGTGGSLALVVPAFVLIGAGMGLVIVPLTTTIMSGVAAEHAGAASGALSTMQSVGAALGVAITGVIFFGALGGGYAHALEMSLAQLAALLVGVAALTRLLPAMRAQAVELA